LTAGTVERRASARTRRRATAAAGFLLGLASGFVYFAGTLYWTGTVIRTFGGIPLPAPSSASVFLGAVSGIFSRTLRAALEPLDRARGCPPGILFAPAAWVATEFSRGVVLGGFPWVLLGNSQVTVLPSSQLASVLGVYGVSGLVALINATIAYATLATGGRTVSLQLRRAQ
jgi:apolipoprotein N-acyltransferase